VKPGKSLAKSVNEALSSSLKPGEYKQVIKIMDAKTKKVLSEGSQTFMVK